MTSPSFARSTRTALILLLLASVARAAALDPVADMDAQYQAVLAALRRPAVTGILVTEILPESPVAIAGLRAGDIITQYYGTKITDLQTLREQVGEALARRVEENAAGRVLLRARRAGSPGVPGEDIVIQVPREPLGIRAIEVVAGVPGPRNPPPNLRGTLKLDWKSLLDTLRADPEFTLRTQESPAPPVPSATTLAAQPIQPEWLGWQKYALKPDPSGEGLSITADANRLDPADDTKITERSSLTVHLQLGDYTNIPAFLLDSASATYPARAEGRATVSITATRTGENLRGTSQLILPDRSAGPAERYNYLTPLTAIPQPAIPLIAAAMPQMPDAVLPIHLLSLHDFLPRPGYVLVTRGRQSLPATTAASSTRLAETAWRVDLLHCGTLIESYWLSGQRRLLAIETQAATPIINRRVAQPADATQPHKENPILQATP